MNSKKNILVTFDYELFQGKQSGTVANCMLLPTQKILTILKKHKATSVFFIDMMYLCRLKEAAAIHLAAKIDFDLIEAQLIEMAAQGHYVFNHLHPHWLDAVYNPAINNWTLLNDSKYTFEALTDTERSYVFNVTMDLLNEILDKAPGRKKADGYRAGGLYIQPFSSFIEQFDKHGIRYEFSVLKNAAGKLQNGKGSFNFSGIKKNIYGFSTDISIENPMGPYTQYAMNFVTIPLHYRLLNSAFYRLFMRSKKHRRHGDGVSTSNPITIADKSIKSSNETFSVEMLNDVKLPLYLKEASQRAYLHLLSHPKLVSDYNLKVFDSLLKKLISAGNTEFDFKKFVSY